MHNRNPECMDLQLVWRRYIFRSRNYSKRWICILTEKFNQQKATSQSAGTGLGKRTYSQLNRDGQSESLQHSWHFPGNFKISQQFPESQLLSSAHSPPFGVPETGLSNATRKMQNTRNLECKYMISCTSNSSIQEWNIFWKYEFVIENYILFLLFSRFFM